MHHHSSLQLNNIGYMERELQFWWNCYWYNFYYGPHSLPEEPVSKQRKLEDSRCMSPSPPPPMLSASASGLTKLKGKPASGRLGLITFRPHSDPNPLPLATRQQITKAGLPQIQSNTKLSSLLPHPCKRRYTGDIVKASLDSTQNSSRKISKRKSGSAIEEIDLTLPSIEQNLDGLTTTIHDVLPECLSKVFSFLDTQSKGRAAQVCKRWRESCYEKSVWKGMEAKLHLKKSNPSLFPSLVRRGIKRVQVLSLKKSLRELVNGIPNLESLNLSGCYNLSDSSLDSAFVREAPRLKVLNLSLCKEVSDNSLGKIASRCKNLEELDLAGCSRVSNNGLFYISSNMKGLRYLNLRSCRLISDQGIGHLTGQNSSLSTGLPRLTDLVLQDCQKLTDEGLKHISVGLKQLETINLSFCVSITDTGIKSLGRIPSLLDLNLRSCDNVSDLGIGFLAEDVAGKSLHSLDISFCANVTDSSAKNIAAGISNLRSLSMANCLINDDGLIKMAKALTKLESLNIGQCKAISDKSLEVVAKELMGLQRIDLYGCSNASDKVIEKIRKMPKMPELNLQLHNCK